MADRGEYFEVCMTSGGGNLGSICHSAKGWYLEAVYDIQGWIFGACMTSRGVYLGTCITQGWISIGACMPSRNDRMIWVVIYGMCMTAKGI